MTGRQRVLGDTPPMAFITRISPVTVDHGKPHTECECGWSVTERDGETVLQLDTYGSAARASGPKVSQSLQLDEEGAKQLLKVLRSVFPAIET